MGNKSHKPPKKLLFEQNILFQPSKTELKKLEKPHFPSSSSETSDPVLEFSQTLQFSSQAFLAFSIFEQQFELTQSNGLFLNYKQFIDKNAYSNTNTDKTMGLLNHIQLIELHSHYEMKEFYKELYDKTSNMSPIQRRNSKINEEEFKTPSPLKKDFQKENNDKKQEKVVKMSFLKEKAEFLMEKTKEKEVFSHEIDEENTEKFEEKKQWFFLKPHFVHFSEVFPNKNPSSEEKIINSLKKLDEKLKKPQFLFDSRQRINEIPLLQLDLYKTSQKPSYTEISAQKNHIFSRESLFDAEEMTYNLEEKKHRKSPFRAGKSTYNAIKHINNPKNKEKTLKKPEKSENTKENLNKSALLLRKKSDNFEKTQKKGNYAENRGNFLYMKYEFPKKNLTNNEKNQKEIMETSLINLKKSLNFARDSKKIYWKNPLQEKNDENSVDLKVSELEKLRKSLFTAKSLHFSQNE